MNSKVKINNLSRLAALSFVCFMVGLYLINEMVWGYGFLIAGLVFAVIDIILKRKRDSSSQAHHN
jgi:4-hydroxybenzoate polyprenyltransferase